jgi:hypothetical protein
MTSNDIELIRKAINSINDPAKLDKISERGEREANAFKEYKGDLNSFQKQMGWMSIMLQAAEKAMNITRDKKIKTK